jgi:4-hydroxybutyrate CoA-transferase
MCSLGVSVDYTFAAVQHAKLVIAQVNDRMPYTGGGGLISVSDIDCFVPFSEPIISLAPPKIGPIEQPSANTVPPLSATGTHFNWALAPFLTPCFPS